MRGSILFAMLVLFTSFSAAQTKGQEITAGHYDSIESEVLSTTRSLQIFLPENYETSNRSYPVLFHLYGDRINQYWLEAVSVVYNLSSPGIMPEVIIVGIDEVDRYRNLLPRDSDGNPTRIDAFTRFVEKELIPYIDGKFRTLDYRILVGPQVGANFGLYTLLNSPDLFDAFILTHPFRWGRGRDYLEERSTEFLAEKKRLRKFLFITSNDDDEYERAGHPYLERFVNAANEADLSGFVVVRNHLGNTGEFTSPTGLKAGLKELFDGFDMPDEVEIENLADIKAYYAKYFKHRGFSVAIPELELIQRSDILEKTDTASAIEILGYTKNLYPKGAMSYCRLGNIYASVEDDGPAIENLEQCVKYAPGYRTAREKLAELKGE